MGHPFRVVAGRHISAESSLFAAENFFIGVMSWGSSLVVVRVSTPALGEELPLMSLL